MVGSGPHQENPHQTAPQQIEPIGSQQQGNFAGPNHEQNQENERNREGSVNTTQMSKSHSQVGSRVSQRQNSNQTMQQEIDDLKKKLCRGGLLPVLTYPLMMKRTTITGRDQELLQVRLSLMKTSPIIDENAGARPVGAWAMTL